MMSSYLPAGVTDSMCDGYDQVCGNCGCKWSNHYVSDTEKYTIKTSWMNEDDSLSSNCPVYDADGQIVYACDTIVGLTGQCDCVGFSEEPYEPEEEYDPEEYYSEDRDSMDYEEYDDEDYPDDDIEDDDYDEEQKLNGK